MINGEITLAIESAISGGSISLSSDDHEIANWIGTSSVSKAEDLLLNIDAMLTANDIRPKQIDLIAVSAGPGSFTGIRIGIATALGLKTGLRIKMSSESALNGMVSMQQDAANIIAAVPMGRNAVCLQSFKKEDHTVAIDEPRTLSDDGFLLFAKAEKRHQLVLHEALYEKIGAGANITNFGVNVAHAIGRLCRQNKDLVTEPLFISKTF